MNLYLYIPPYSAHSKQLFKSIIYSTIRRYWLQNSNWNDLRYILQLFHQRLLDRGYNKQVLFTTFIDSLSLLNKQFPFETTDSLKTQPKKLSLIKKNNDPEEAQNIFFHMEFHKQGIKNSTIQKTFQNTFCNKKSFTRNTPTGQKETYTSPGLTEGIPGITRNIKIKTDRLIIALSKPKTLRDELNPSTLFLPPHLSVNTQIEKIKQK